MKRKASVTISKEIYCWLFGGFGFHNSEATMTGLMSERLLNEYVLKTFGEISPSFSRVFGGYADWTKKAMDSFADYYDRTFRKAGTTLYLVPGRMPHMVSAFDERALAENVAERLAYLIRERGCRKIRYYCATNELSCGNTYCYFEKHLEDFKKIHTALYEAFDARHLDVGLLATDASGFSKLPLNDWALGNMDEVTEAYCWHNYIFDTPAGDPGIYPKLYEACHEQVQKALKKEKRFILGEFGVKHPLSFRSDVMRNDVGRGFDDDKESAMTALTLAEEEMAALNAGCLAAVSWTFMDYPDPFLREDGDTEEERIRYDCARFSGHGISIRYNKWGLFRWDGETDDNRSRAPLYTLGPIARYFRKGSRVLTCKTSAEGLRCGAVIYPDGGISVCLINNSGAETETEVVLDGTLGREKPYRCFAYDVENVPYNDFNDLQPFTLSEDGRITLPPMSMVLLTTEYTDRIPSKITGIRKEGNVLRWDACPDEEHGYYRVFRDGKQIASTVAEYLSRPTLPEGKYEVLSVDKWGNVRKS